MQRGPVVFVWPQYVVFVQYLTHFIDAARKRRHTRAIGDCEVFHAMHVGLKDELLFNGTLSRATKGVAHARARVCANDARAWRDTGAITRPNA